jgi:hypothetical protein
VGLAERKVGVEEEVGAEAPHGAQTTMATGAAELGAEGGPDAADGQQGKLAAAGEGAAAAGEEAGWGSMGTLLLGGEGRDSTEAML